jgi:hypothetical protein
MTIDSTSPPDVDSAINVDTNDKINIDSAIDAAAVIDVSAVVETNDKIDIDSAIDAAAVIAVPAIVDTNDKIDIDFAIDTAVGIAVPSIISTTSLEPEVDIAGSTVIISATAGGFDMAFRLFNFHVDNDGVAELISASDSMPPATAPTTSPVAMGNPSETDRRRRWRRNQGRKIRPHQ